jgi:succinyl-CoA synthetase beta subunit
MNIHEYQAKALLATYGVPVPQGAPAFSVEEALHAATRVKGPPWVVKAQIHAGGRGKGGGVKIARNLDDVRDLSGRMLGMTLITHQTGPQGRKVRRLYIEEGLEIARELYLSLLVDRARARVSIIASSEGGMEIEEVARLAPEKILRVGIDPVTGLQPFHVRKIGFGLGLDDNAVRALEKLLRGLYRAFVALDAALIEINPLVVTKAGLLVALDAKMNFDDNALFRHKDVADLRDVGEEDPAEVEAGKHGLNYIKLDGTIGCMVNGAGLAMATMDIIKLYGAEPANFLDVGGGASQDKVTAAFKILLADPHVKGVLVNIFGGIMRCDVIAEGVVAAAREVGLNMPLVVRLEGNNVEQGRKILAQSGLSIIAASDLADAAGKVVQAVKAAV